MLPAAGIAQEHASAKDEHAPAAALLRIATGSWLSQCVYVVAKLGIADLLLECPSSADTLGSRTGLNAGALHRVLRALSSVGVFQEDGDRRFHLTPIAACLCTNAPESLRAFAVMLGEQEHWRAWGEILYSVTTGKPAFEHVFGVQRFEYFADHPEDSRIFTDAMTSRAAAENAAIISAYDFSEIGRVIDVGGGHGSLLEAILAVTSRTRCVLFDLANVVPLALERAVRTNHAPRYEVVAGSFFDAVPAGAEAYVLKKVIQDWDDEHAVAILKNCRAAMPHSGRLILIEPLVPPGNAPSFNKLLDLLLLVWTPGGRVRTEDEHRKLLAAAKLKIERVIATRSWLTIIEASPV